MYELKRWPITVFDRGLATEPTIYWTKPTIIWIYNIGKKIWNYYWKFPLADKPTRQFFTSHGDWNWPFRFATKCSSWKATKYVWVNVNWYKKSFWKSIPFGDPITFDSTGFFRVKSNSWRHFFLTKSLSLAKNL